MTTEAEMFRLARMRSAIKRVARQRAMREYGPRPKNLLAEHRRIAIKSVHNAQRALDGRYNWNRGARGPQHAAVA